MRPFVPWAANPAHLTRYPAAFGQRQEDIRVLLPAKSRLSHLFTHHIEVWQHPVNLCTISPAPSYGTADISDYGPPDHKHGP